MLTELLIKEGVKAIFTLANSRTKNLNLTLNCTKSNIENSLNQHLRMVKNWSGEITFKDIKSAKNTQSIYIQLNIFLYPKRIRISTDEEIAIVPITKIFDNEKNHIVILGQPGAGKTTSMKFLCQSVFFNKEFYPDLFSYPLLVKLRDFNKPIKSKYNAGIIVEYLFNELGLSIKPENYDEKNIETFVRTKEKLVVDILNNTGCILIIEGFDELVYKKHRQIVLEEISSLANQVEFSRIVITSRTADYNYNFDNISQFELCSLTKPQIKEFAEKWLGSVKAATEFNNAVHKSPFADTTIRPLTVAHLCAIYERVGKIPEKPKTVYRKIVGLLLEEWDEQRNIRRSSEYASFELDRKFDFLASLAFRLTVSSKQSIFSKREFANAYKSIHQDFDLKLNETKLVVQELESHTGLFIQSGFEFFEFAHKSLQEYLTAEYLVKLPTIPANRNLIESLPNELAIAIAISSNPSMYFVELVNNRLNSIKMSVRFTQTFINRLLLEKPDFNKNEFVGLSALILYSMYLNKTDDDSQLSLFIVDDLVDEFESFILEIIKRNSLTKILQLYKVASQYESTNGIKIQTLTLIDSENAKAPIRKPGMIYSKTTKLPRYINCRETFLKTANPI
ncbi:MAG: NACHT domain-containing protein [Reichenbachiella sp.]|uniref:NACHT domain-containing protein n=1 Tax=Reichenbachiella sp. TaxID=2184521 RepID=UPI0032676EF3